MTEPTTCSKCGGLVQKITTPIQHDMPPSGPYGVVQKQTVAVDYHFRCRQCGKESAKARGLLDAISNWDLNMKYQIQYAGKTNDDWDTFITVYSSL